MLRSQYNVYNGEGVDSKVYPLAVFYGFAYAGITKANFAPKIGTSEGNIKSLNVRGSDIYVTVANPIADVFQGYANISPNGYEIYDEGCFAPNSGPHPLRIQSTIKKVTFKKMQKIERQFCFNSAMEEVYLPNVTQTSKTTGATTEEGFFAGCGQIRIIDMRKCKEIGTSPSVDSSAFSIIKSGCVINVNLFLKTSNAGSPDVDIQYAKTSRSATINFYDDNGIYHSTL